LIRSISAGGRGTAGSGTAICGTMVTARSRRSGGRWAAT
jgi:hypothetical protein